MRNNRLLMFAVLLALPSIASASEFRFPNPPGKAGKSVRATTTVSLKEEPNHNAAVDLGKIDNYTPVVVPPETTTVVTMINSDVNRIVCPVCVFRGKPATDSDRSRPPIPIQVGHPFRLISATP